MKNKYIIGLIFFTFYSKAHFYDPRTWAVSTWVSKLRSKITSYFSSQPLRDDRVSQKPINNDVVPSKFTNQINNEVVPSKFTNQKNYIDGYVYTSRPINPFLSEDTNKVIQVSENNDLLHLVYASGIDPYDSHLFGAEEYSLSFSVRHLDEYLYHKYGCSFAISVVEGFPLFYFSVPLETSIETLKQSFGIVLTPIRELITVFLAGQFTHGRMAVSNYNSQKYEYKKLNSIGGGGGGGDKNAIFKHYMMPFSQRPLFKEDRKLQKIMYSWILSSTIANNFDILRIEESERQRIIADQKKLPDIYKQLFLERIKELAGQEMTQKNTPSSANRLSMISGHIKK